MANYTTDKALTLKAKTSVVYPAPPQKEAVTYAHATFDHHGLEVHVSFPLDQALQMGLIHDETAPDA